MAWCARSRRRARLRLLASEAPRARLRRTARASPFAPRRVAAALSTRRGAARRARRPAPATGRRRCERGRAVPPRRRTRGALFAHADAARAPRGGAGAGPPARPPSTSGSAICARSLGDYGGALAATRAPRPNASGIRSRRSSKVGGVYRRRGEWERPEARLAAALDAAVPPGATACGPACRRPRPRAPPMGQPGLSRRGREALEVARPPPTGEPRPRPTTCSACSPGAWRQSRRARSSRAALARGELRIPRPGRGAQQPRARRRDAGELEAAPADEACAGALCRYGRPPPRGRPREQPRGPASRRGAR